MAGLEIKDSTSNLSHKRNAYEKLNREHIEKIVGHGSLPKIDQGYNKTGDEHLGDSDFISELANENQDNNEFSLNNRTIHDNVQAKDGVKIEDELPLYKNINVKADGTEVGEHPPDYHSKKGSQQIDSVDDYLQPIPQQLIPRYVCDQKSSVINDYLELEVYDEIDNSPNKNKVSFPGEGQSQRTIPERKGPLPVPGDSPRRPSGRRNVLIIVVSVLTVVTVLSVGISLGVYFSSDRQKESTQGKVGEATSVIPTANPDSLVMVNDACTIYPCFNGGSCRMNQHQPSCVCGHGYSGDYCEKILHCVNHPCLHGGSCVEDSHQARCECSLGYHGNNCEIDVALTEQDITSEIAACRASTEYSSNSQCEEALDGDTSSHSCWISREEGVGAWYEMYFREPRVVTQLHVMQRCYPGEQTDRMTLLFGNNFTQEIELKCNSYDCEFGLQEFRINPGAKSSFIRITFTHVCSTYNNGLIELKVWGY